MVKTFKAVKMVVLFKIVDFVFLKYFQKKKKKTVENKKIVQMISGWEKPL